MPRSPMERLVSGETFYIKAGDLGVQVSADKVYIHGCDCAAAMPTANVRELNHVLGAFLRHQRNKEKKNSAV
ncbi:hypothetical protein [Streptomyces sp. NPDC004528]|uniref:hypothetical protein n=1 Tax=Streptomyces sp. NPDC004528 TaxID=3154550 RepID=UPI0033A9DA14